MIEVWRPGRSEGRRRSQGRHRHAGKHDARHATPDVSAPAVAADAAASAPPAELTMPGEQTADQPALRPTPPSPKAIPAIVVGRGPISASTARAVNATGHPTTRRAMNGRNGKSGAKNDTRNGARRRRTRIRRFRQARGAQGPTRGRSQGAPVEHDPEKACPGLDPGWNPAFRKDHAPMRLDRRRYTTANASTDGFGMRAGADPFRGGSFGGGRLCPRQWCADQRAGPHGASRAMTNCWRSIAR